MWISIFGAGMDEADRLRDFAKRCREQAETAHETTAATLRLLADEYEAQADEIERDHRPEPEQPPS